MAKVEYVGQKNFKDKDFVFLYALQEKTGESYIGKVAKEYKFVKKEMLPRDLAVGDIINIDLDENDFGKTDIVGIDIIRKGGVK